MSVTSVVQPSRTIPPPVVQQRAPAARVAYLVSRFPKITETFVLYEMVALERQGTTVELYSLQRERTAVMHPEAEEMLERVHFAWPISLSIARANAHFLRRSPRVFLGALWTLLRANWGSRRYFAAAVLFFPKVVYFAWKMQQQGVTHLHAHFASHPAAAAWLIHRLTGIPYSFTAHGSDLHRDQHMLREKVAEAEFVAAISCYNRDLIVQHCGRGAEGKVEVIHCGVDTELFRPAAIGAQPSGPQSELQILCIGTLHEVKGQTVLLAACERLKQRGVDFRCHFVGDGPDQPNLQQQAQRAQLSECVIFHGRKTREEIQQLIAQAHVVVAPSVVSRDGRREGIPVVLMEAMASGVAVVASRLSGIPELVEDGVTGLLVEPRDAGGFADAIGSLADDAQWRQELGRAGRQRVLREFDLRANAALLASRFSSVAVSRRQRHPGDKGEQR